MTLCKCRECDKEVSTKTEHCPNCGVAAPSIQPWTTDQKIVAYCFVGGLFIFAIIYVIFSEMQPEGYDPEIEMWERQIERRQEELDEKIRRNEANRRKAIRDFQMNEPARLQREANEAQRKLEEIKNR